MFALPHDAAGETPSIAAAFANYRTHEVISLVDSVRYDTVDAPATAGGTSTEDAERIERRHNLGKAGVITMLVSTGAEIAGIGVLLATATYAVDGSTSEVGLLGGSLLGVGLLAGGAVGSIVGEVMLFTGGIGASQLLGIPTTVGWVGVGLAIGSVAVGLVLPEVSPLFSIGGLVCGAVQLGEAGHAGREGGILSLYVAPSPNGIRLAGTF